MLALYLGLCVDTVTIAPTCVLEGFGLSVLGLKGPLRTFKVQGQGSWNQQTSRTAETYVGYTKSLSCLSGMAMPPNRPTWVPVRPRPTMYLSTGTAIHPENPEP